LRAEILGCEHSVFSERTHLEEQVANIGIVVQRLSQRGGWDHRRARGGDGLRLADGNRLPNGFAMWGGWRVHRRALFRE
jgi:hypothetical protein